MRRNCVSVAPCGAESMRHSRRLPDNAVQTGCGARQTSAKPAFAACAAGLLLASFISAAASANSVTSGGDCANARATAYDLKKHERNAQDMALALLGFLNDNVQRVAIVSRAGSDLSGYRFRRPSKQKYTHAGLAWKSSRDGLWRFRHVLNVCAGESSDIFVQSLVQFFDDDPFYYDVRAGVPSVELQEGIASILEDEEASQRLHNPKYSNIANPFNTQYQNSNGWVLAVIASAQVGLKTYQDVQSRFGRLGYVPSQVKVGFFRQFGSLFTANATVEDHPRPVDGWFEFVSAASLYRYVGTTDRLLRNVELCHVAGCGIPVRIVSANGASDRTRNRSELGRTGVDAERR